MISKNREQNLYDLYDSLRKHAASQVFPLPLDFRHTTLLLISPFKICEHGNDTLIQPSF